MHSSATIYDLFGYGFLHSFIFVIVVLSIYGSCWFIIVAAECCLTLTWLIEECT